MPITVLPTLNRFSPTFKTDVDTFFGSQIPTFCTEANTLQADVNAKQVTATAAAVDATNQAALAANQVTLAAAQVSLATLQAAAAASSAIAAGAVAWVSGTTYAIGNARFSPANGQTYRRLTAGAGTTDPSADATNWIVINGLTSEAIPLPANNLPTARPSLNLNFASSQTVDPRITFTRASTATRTNSKGLIETVASGAPRIDYDAVTGVCKGLLIEESRVNLLTYSEQLDNAAWVKNQVTLTANSVTAPDGTITADKMIENAVNQAFYVTGSVTSMTTSTIYTGSVYAKAAERSVLQLTYQGATHGSTYYANFNLSSGVVGSSGGSGVSSTITSVGGGWYRCSISAPATLTASGGLVVGVVPSTASVRLDTYTGDGTSGLFIWGAQLEVGAFATSYIPTVASQVTRAADVASMTGTNFSSWYRQDEGSFVASGDRIALGGNYPHLFGVTDGDANEQISIAHDTAAGYKRYLHVSNGGVTQVNLGSAETIVANTIYTAALAYKANDFGFSRGGEAAQTDVSGTVPVVNQLLLGWRHSPIYLNGHIARLAYYPERVTNAELQALSTQ